MNDYIPKLDIPVEFLVGDSIDVEILKLYTRFPCKMRSAIFFLCTDGELKATINFSDFHVKKGDFVFLIPESFIQVHDISQDFKFQFAAFSSDFINSVNLVRTTFEFVPIISQNPLLKLDNETFQLYNEYYKALLRSTKSELFVFNREVKKSILNIILEQVWSMYSKRHHQTHNGISREMEIYMEFTILLHNNYMKEHRVAFYAERLGITIQHFCNTIKKATGSTASDIINKFLVMETKTRLKFTDMPIKNISLELGFTNIPFFHKWFKEHTGITPQQYREN